MLTVTPSWLKWRTPRAWLLANLVKPASSRFSGRLLSGEQQRKLPNINLWPSYRALTHTQPWRCMKTQQRIGDIDNVRLTVEKSYCLMGRESHFWKMKILWGWIAVEVLICMSYMQLEMWYIYTVYIFLWHKMNYNEISQHFPWSNW